MQELNTCGNQYEADNAWFRNDWGERRQYALNAWRLYQQASTNALGMLLLGSAKIRKDSVLVSNFGMTSAGGVIDPEEVALVEALETERTDQRAAPGLRDAPDVLGPGSILNDKNWTPLLNDCYILGGVHGGHEFHLAEDSANAYFESLGGQLTARDNWRSYFSTHQDAVWDTTRQVPRILARELIGLKTFGYRPRFFPEQLSFSATQSDGATFKTYLDALVAAGITSRNRTVVLETVSLFLFGNAAA
ncbi:MAG: hypothetical protein ABJA98_28790 [Acidobacteriota bacterium]